MRNKKDKFITFAEMDHRAYVKDAFNLFLVMGCFICVTQALFSVPVPTMFDRFANNNLIICLRQSLSMLYQGVALYAPFLILIIAKNRSAGRYFSNKDSLAKPGHYILGALSVTGLGIAIYYLSTFIIIKMTNDGFVINESLPLLGNNSLTFSSFIISATVIPAFFTEITFRGIIMTEIKKDSYVFAVVVASFINSVSHLSFLQMPFMFVTGLISGWICLKTKTLWVSYVSNGIMNGAIAGLYVFKTVNTSAYNSVMPVLTAICGIIGILSLIGLFIIYGFKIEKQNKGLSKKDSLKAFFGAFGLWILIFITVFEVFFLYIKKPRKEENLNPTAVVEVF